MGRRASRGESLEVNSVDSEVKAEIKEEKKIEEVKIESPQSAQRRVAVKQKEQAKKDSGIVKESYEIKGDKVVKLIVKKNGNKHRRFILNRVKDKAAYEMLVKKAEKEGLKIEII